MLDFDLLHEKAQKLADLTRPGSREPGFVTWCIAVGSIWKEIVCMWNPSMIESPESDLEQARRRAR
jgi:hypothetical protein